MKIALLNDTHAGIRNSSEIFSDNANTFYEKVFFPYCIENDIKTIIHLGDFFDDRKNINIKSLHSIRKNFLQKLRDHGMHMDIIFGNHDVFYKNSNELNSLKEVLGYWVNEVNIVTSPRVLEYGGMKLALLPWITSDNYAESMKFVESAPADWLLGHLELSGFEVLKGVEMKEGMDKKLFSRFERVLSGHFHTKSEQDNVTYLGSQLEFTWADAHDDKFFHVLDTKTREIESVRNPHTLYERIYYDDSMGAGKYQEMDLAYLVGKFVKVVTISKADLFTFDEFIDKIQKQDILKLQIAESFAEFVGENVGDADEEINLEETEELLDSYVEAVDTGLNKDKLKKMMRSLHTEALAFEVS